MYTFDEKFKKGAARAFRAQNGMTAFLGGLNKLLPEPPAFGECKTKEEELTVARIADTAGDRWYLGFSEQSIVPRDVGEKAYYIGGNLSEYGDFRTVACRNMKSGLPHEGEKSDRF